MSECRQHGPSSRCETCPTCDWEQRREAQLLADRAIGFFYVALVAALLAVAIVAVGTCAGAG